MISLSTHKKSTRTQASVTHALNIIHAFTNAKTTQHDNASRSALYVEIYFSERGRLSGATFLPYALEKNRVTAAGQNERNFHVFYNLLAGATHDEKIRLNLADWSTFQYLSKTTTSRAVSLDDAAADMELRVALKAIVFQKQRIAQIYQVLAAILHLGNIQFVEDPNNAQDAAITKNTDSLTLASDLLGVDPNSLMSALTFKSKLIKRDITTLFLDPEQSSKQRDDLAQSLYCLLFTWLTEQINDRLATKSVQSFISLLDIPGWISKPSEAGFDQLAFHFIQESIHQFMLTSIFERDRQEYVEQGIPLIEHWPSSASTLDLFVHQSKGLWSIMNSQASRQQQQLRYDDDEVLMDNYLSANKTAINEQMIAFKKSDTGSRQFTIQHFWGPITYEPRQFTERNQDYLCNDFISLFCGNAYNPPTSNGLVAAMFHDAILGQDDGTKNRVLSQQQGIRPLRSPTVQINSSASINSKPADTKSTMSTSINSDVLTISDLLVSGVTDLTHALANTLPWSVLCVRPNDLALPNSCDLKRIVAQQSFFKVADMVKRLRVGYYTTVFTMDEFWERYHVSLPLTLNSMLDSSLPLKERCIHISQSLGWSQSWMTTGKNKVQTKNPNFILTAFLISSF